MMFPGFIFELRPPSTTALNPSCAIFLSDANMLKSLQTIKHPETTSLWHIWRAIQQDVQIPQSYCGSGFHTVRFPVYDWKAIVAVIELDFILQQQPMPSYHSFHFDAYYNSFTQTWEESQQPITPTCIQFTSALPETLTPPCPTMHCTASFLFFFYLIYQMKGGQGEKNIWKAGRGAHAHIYNLYPESLIA